MKKSASTDHLKLSDEIIMLPSDLQSCDLSLQELNITTDEKDAS